LVGFIRARTDKKKATDFVKVLTTANCVWEKYL